MLAFSNALAHLTNLSPRVEVHGDEEKRAADLAFSLTTSNLYLDMLAPGLRAALYTHAPGATQDMIDSELLTKLRYPLMDAFRWMIALENAAVDIASNVMLRECKVNKVRISPLEGGSVEVAFRVQCYPSQDEAGTLYMLQRQEVRLSIIPEADPPTRRQPKVDTQTLDLIPSSDSHALALAILGDYGYTVLVDEIRVWSAEELEGAMHYCEQLSEIGTSGAAPPVPEVLRRFPRVLPQHEEGQ